MKVTLEISPRFLILLAAAVQLLPLWLLMSAVFAAAVHEMSHYLALKLCGIPVYRIKIGVGGSGLYTAPLSPGEEILCASAGPLGSLMLFLLLPLLPGPAFCGLVQGVFNLLPVYPLDGGRVLRAILRLFRVWERKSSCKERCKRVQ